MPGSIDEFNDFYKRCADNHISLDARLKRAGFAALPKVGRPTYTPSGMYAAIARAGEILRREPERSLANSIIRREVLYGFTHSVASRAFAAIVNASMQPVRARSWDASFVCRGAPRADTCIHAERYFGATVLQMLHPVHRLDGYNHKIGYQKIMGENNRLIAMRKGEGASTALTFEEVVINGVPYPPGSIVSMRLIDQYRSGVYRRHRYSAYEEVSVERVAYASFQRISAFALPPSKRRAAFPHVIEATLSLLEHWPQAGYSEYDIVNRWSLARIRETAMRAS